MKSNLSMFSPAASPAATLGSLSVLAALSGIMILPSGAEPVGDPATDTDLKIQYAGRTALMAGRDAAAACQWGEDYVATVVSMPAGFSTTPVKAMRTLPDGSMIVRSQVDIPAGVCGGCPTVGG